MKYAETMQKTRQNPAQRQMGIEPLTVSKPVGRLN